MFSPKWRKKCQIEEIKNTRKSLPRSVGELPDQAVDRPNYIYPWSGGYLQSRGSRPINDREKSAVLYVDIYISIKI